ncbi:MAG: histidine phosphatase family protein [SAR324 cluster bacterium]|nr:histidine phosphatase family protein [SAR324 cluster bacterium]
MELFLIRHAESKNNIRKSGDERFADPEITNNGHSQSEHLAKYLQEGLHLSREERDLRTRPFDQLYTSAMTRALQTVQPIAAAGEIEAEVWIDIHEIGGLYTLNSDQTKKVAYPGMNRNEINNRFPGHILPNELDDHGWWNKEAESIEDTFERVEKVLQNLLGRADESSLIGMVTHGGFMSILMCKLCNLTAGEGTAFQSHNCSVSRISFEKESKITIQYWNSFYFLPENLKVPRPECDY